MLRRSSQMIFHCERRRAGVVREQVLGARRRRRAVVSRKARPGLNGKKHPLHITMRALPEIRSLRVLHFWIRRALLTASERPDFRVVSDPCSSAIYLVGFAKSPLPRPHT